MPNSFPVCPIGYLIIALLLNLKYPKTLNTKYISPAWFTAILSCQAAPMKPADLQKILKQRCMLAITKIEQTMKKPAVFPLYLSLLLLGWSTIIPVKSMAGVPVLSCEDNGLYYQETLSDGSVRHVIEKNVVVLNQKLKAIPADADEKTLEKLSRENKKIEQANQARLNSVKEFEKFFNSSSINGAKNSSGESVFFKFNIIEEKVENTACIQTSKALSRKYALPSALTTPSGNKVMVYAAILTTVSANGEMGKAQGNIIYQVSAKAPEGTLSHELGHALYLYDSYGLASSEFGDGLMGAEPQPITPQEVDQIIQKCLKRDQKCTMI